VTNRRIENGENVRTVTLIKLRIKYNLLKYASSLQNASN
jgi:hypothetical protein